MSDAEDERRAKIVALIKQESQPLEAGGGIVVSGTGHVVGGRDVYVNTKPPRPRVVFTPGPDSLTAEQARQLTALVKSVVAAEAVRKEPRTQRQVWTALNAKMKVATYREIPAARFDEAVAYLQQWRGRLMSAKSAPDKLGSAWRNLRYRAIKARVRSAGLEAWYSDWLQSHFQTDSLTALDDAQLQQTYQAVMGKR